MKQTVRSRSKEEAGSVSLIALFALMILSLLGLVLLSSSNTDSRVAINGVWSEGAFDAAEAGVHQGIDQLSTNLTTSVQAVPVTSIGDSYSYRSGRRTDSTAQPLQFIRSQSESGYSLDSGTGYNASGYTFYVYQVNATGQGPLNTQREVEVQAEFGPAPK